jgi:hypothetical protein
MTLHTLRLELVLFFLLVLNSVKHARTLLLALTTLVFLVHDLVELVITKSIPTVLLHTLFEFLNVFDVFIFLDMLGPHFMVFQRFMQLFVLALMLFLLKGFDFLLLLEKPHLDAGHVVVTFQHLSEKIVGSRYRYMGLYQEFHAFHHVCTY